MKKLLFTLLLLFICITNVNAENSIYQEDCNIYKSYIESYKKIINTNNTTSTRQANIAAAIAGQGGATLSQSTIDSLIQNNINESNTNEINNEINNEIDKLTIKYEECLLSNIEGKVNDSIKSSNIDINLDNNIITIKSFEANFNTKEGSDGRVIAYPSLFNIKEGSDGRAIAYPSLFNTKEGSDGRAIAYPASSNWTTKEGKDGRIVAFPTSYIWSTREGNDGRIVPYLNGSNTKEGKDGRIINYPTGSTWTNQEGKDGRIVAFPTSYIWSTKEGKDGRIVPYQTSSIITKKEGSDGRIVAYPTSSTWNTKEGKNGRVIAYPTSSIWNIKEGNDGKIVAYPNGKIENIEIINIDIGNLKYLDELKNDFSSTNDFINYVLYYWINYDDLKSEKKDNNISTSVSNSDNIKSCGLNSALNSNGGCSCILGYTWKYPDETNNFDCVILEINNTETCKLNYGLASYYSNNSCLCEKGYKKNIGGNYCIEDTDIKSCGLNSALNNNGECSCNSGYIWENYNDSKNFNCIKSETINGNAADLKSTYGILYLLGEDDYGNEYTYVNYLSDLGVINKKDKIEDYNLDKNVLRQEIAAVAIGVAGISKKDKCNNYFSDVSQNTPNTWACNSIEALLDAGLIAKNNYFKPESNISKAEAVGMMIKAKFKNEYSYNSNNSDSWQKQVVDYAVSKGLVENFSDYDGVATRGFVFEIGANAKAYSD